MYLLFPSNQDVIIGKETGGQKKNKKKERIKLESQK